MRCVVATISMLFIWTLNAQAGFFSSESKYNNFFGLKLGMAVEAVTKDAKYSSCKKRQGPKHFEELGYTEYACENPSSTISQLILGFFKNRLMQITARVFGGKESYDAIMGKYGTPTHEYSYSQFPVGTKIEESNCGGRCSSIIWDDPSNKVRASAVAVPSLKAISYLQITDLKMTEEYAKAEQQRGRKTANDLGY